jgi:hypothetical protein
LLFGLMVWLTLGPPPNNTKPIFTAERVR